MNFPWFCKLRILDELKPKRDSKDSDAKSSDHPHIASLLNDRVPVVFVPLSQGIDVFRSQSQLAKLVDLCFVHGSCGDHAKFVGKGGFWASHHVHHLVLGVHWAPVIWVELSHVLRNLSLEKIRKDCNQVLLARISKVNLWSSFHVSIVSLYLHFKLDYLLSLKQ